METPIPAPRWSALEVKKPVPTPRKTVPKLHKSESFKMSEEHTNTFSKRVRSLSNASKQIAEDIGDLVQDKKKAVIEGTRQSVRRITKRFNSNHNNTDEAQRVPETDHFSDDTMDMFNSISFQSPINRTQSIYNNVEDSIEEEFSAPPPAHPPPPLPDDSIYDAPASTSGSTSNSDRSNVSPFQPQNYESVFPIITNNNNNTNSESDLSRSGSWKFYDPVTKAENIYNDIDGAVILPQVLSNASEDLNPSVSEFSVEVQNSVYENYEFVSKCEAEKRKRPSQSVILQFDPLKNFVSTSGMSNN